MFKAVKNLSCIEIIGANLKEVEVARLVQWAGDNFKVYFDSRCIDFVLFSTNSHDIDILWNRMNDANLII